MTIDSVIAGALAWGNSPLGVGVLTAVILAGVRFLPRLLHRFIRGVSNAPEGMLMGALNFIDRRTSSKSEGLL